MRQESCGLSGIGKNRTYLHAFNRISRSLSLPPHSSQIPPNNLNIRIFPDISTSFTINKYLLLKQLLTIHFRQSNTR
jgi:hypothetical protein